LNPIVPATRRHAFCGWQQRGALHRSGSAVRYQLSLSGGLLPRVRRRAASALTFAEREEVARGVCAGRSLRAIAGGLGRAPSTVSREVARHWGRSGYRANHADYEASVAALRSKPCRLALNARLCRAVAGRLALEWSPELISGWLKKHYPTDETMHVSHETIYKSLFIQARGVLKKELVRHLRTRRPIRHARAKGGREQLRGKISGAISIRERPAEAEDRAVPGHREGDLLCGSLRSQIITLVERHSRFTTSIKVKDAKSETVVNALARHPRTLPRKLKRSLTWDQGKEMANHKSFSVATDVKVYFCDPNSSWQRGTNENTNGLLRQYFPKGTDLSKYTQPQRDRVALRLKQRPRETLGIETPADRLRQCVALIA
jgi:IS30 family transposase